MKVSPIDRMVNAGNQTVNAMNETMNTTNETMNNYVSYLFLTNCVGKAENRNTDIQQLFHLCDLSPRVRHLFVSTQTLLPVRTSSLLTRIELRSSLPRKLYPYSRVARMPNLSRHG